MCSDSGLGVAAILCAAYLLSVDGGNAAAAISRVEARRGPLRLELDDMEAFDSFIAEYAETTPDLKRSLPPKKDKWRVPPFELPAASVPPTQRTALAVAAAWGAELGARAPPADADHRPPFEEPMWSMWRSAGPDGPPEKKRKPLGAPARSKKRRADAGVDDIYADAGIEIDLAERSPRSAAAARWFAGPPLTL